MSQGQPAPQKKKRTGLIILLVILGVIFVGVAGCVVATGALFKGVVDSVAESMDPANNSKTGLADGSYTMVPDSSAVLNDQCSFTGKAYDVNDLAVPVASSVTVVGQGALCARGTDTVVVEFSVTGGVAAITATS